MLESLARSPTTEQRLADRARIVLLAAAGRSTRSIARALGTWPGRVSRWRMRYAEHGLDGLSDRPRPGPARRYGAETEKRVLARLDRPPPVGFVRWTGPLLAAALGDVSVHRVWKVLRDNRISLAQSHSWCESPDPEFVAQGGRDRRALSQPARGRHRAGGRRETPHPGPGTRPGLPQAAQRPFAAGPRLDLQAPWHHDALCRP